MLKNLKSLFFTEDESEEVKSKKVVSKEIPKTATEKVTIENKSAPININATGSVDNAIVEKLLIAIENNNLEGFDYLEFKKALKALDKIPMDEATKYRSTYAAASTMGATLETLLETIKHYIGVLDAENSTFIKAFEGQLASKVGNKEKEITQFEAVINEKSEKIKQLTNEITKHQNQISELKRLVDDSSQKITKTQNDFKMSYLHIRTQFEQDAQKIKQYIK
ncbi:hypothetical protein [Tenacibaculum finnmarkense]|uniref:hypothetical protein n=1 Tax=Tenacibaculum finnmarkense TaxID=2781243 RepID=UPI001EFB05B4|nr:hypothetical protein [Tenacibaculum finnmarkense]MCG8802323.1 hypothetical protein [Tenacibaculum finnmarkense]MCG8825051.1 hypothetical protein [Tenacibaculum finnmarkense]